MKWAGVGNYLSNFPSISLSLSRQPFITRGYNIIMDSLVLVLACSKVGPARKNRFRQFPSRAATQLAAVIQPYTTH